MIALEIFLAVIMFNVIIVDITCLAFLLKIFLRSGTLAVLELKRDQKLKGVITSFQAYCRGYLARSKINKLKVSTLNFSPDNGLFY